MRELIQSETEAVSGAGWLREFTDDLRYTIESMPGLYEAAIESMAGMMCLFTGNC
jgi:hypothetical protein